MPSKVTIRTVARRAGVSVQTVSNVVNSPHLVKQETRAHVQAVIDELGYRASQAARQMRSGRSRLIGVMTGPICTLSSSPLPTRSDRAVSTIASRNLLCASPTVTATDTARQRWPAHPKALSLTMRDVILVRQNAGIKVRKPSQGTFPTLLRVNVAGITVDVTRGWTALEAKVRGGNWFKFVNLHHEAFDSSNSNTTNQGSTVGQGQIREAQAKSLIAPGGPVTGKLPVVLVGDLNSDDDTVGNDGDVRTLVGETLEALAPGAVIVDHTTTSAVVARAMAELAASSGRAFVDAPVSGGQAGAENGQLTIMCGGAAGAYAKAEPVMAAYAKAMRLIGGPGSGQLVKMVNQICIAGVLQGLAEGMHFAKRAGLDPMAVYDAISKGAAQSWQMDNRWPSMNDGKFDFGFAVDWMRKDLGICLAEARRNGANLPVTALVDQFYSEVQKMGGKRWDTSSLIARLDR